MCAKSAKKSANKTAPPVAPAIAPATASAPAPVAAAPGEPAMATPPAWIDSTDPRKRLLGRVVLIGVWIYVAALCLLALDQTFHWGIFGPKVPPVP